MAYKILVIDDEQINLMMLEEYLSDTDYDVMSFQTAKEGLDYLQSGIQVDAILLDRMMPEMSGMELLEILKQDDHFKRIPVIMQTAAAAQEQIAEGVRAGVFYYLTKPFSKTLVLSVLENALKDYSIYDDLKDQLAKANAAMALVDNCSMSFQTLDQVKNASFYLASFYPKPEEVIMGLSELMINAVEHGNLGITYSEKTLLNHNKNWEDEVRKRLAMPVNQEKFAKAHITRTSDHVILTIEDQGKGFDWEQYMEIDPSRIADNHGRGIAISKMMSFDTIEYIAPGNKVICTNNL